MLENLWHKLKGENKRVILGSDLTKSLQNEKQRYETTTDRNVIS